MFHATIAAVAYAQYVPVPALTSSSNFSCTFNFAAELWMQMSPTPNKPTDGGLLDALPIPITLPTSTYIHTNAPASMEVRTAPSSRKPDSALLHRCHGS
jgi:hypothetical protein